MIKNGWKIYNEGGKYRILVTKNLVGEKWLQILTKGDCRIEVGQKKTILSSEEIVNAIGNKCDGVLGQLTEKWDENLFKSLKNAGCRVYSNVAVGYDNVNIQAATKFGIPVGNTPGVLTETSAEFTAALTLSAIRRVVEADKFMRSGNFKGWLMDLMVGQLLQGKTLGIIGMGRIGSSFTQMMVRGFKMNCIYFSSRKNQEVEDKISKFNQFLMDVGEFDKPITCRQVDSIEELLKLSDVVSLHVSMSSKNKHLINKSRLQLMKQNAILVNGARGPVVDEQALVEHLKNNPEFRAALDVYENEPLMAEGLEHLENAILAPHIASATLWTRGGMSVLASLNVLGVLSGYPLWNKPVISPFLEDDIQQIPKYIPSIINAKELNIK